MAKVRFVFGKEMSDERMWEAVKKMAKECGFKVKDNRKKKAKDSRAIREGVKNGKEGWRKITSC
jgi:hypothetical protein